MRKIGGFVLSAGLLCTTLAWAQSQRTQQTQKPQQIDEQPKSSQKSETPKGTRREGDLPAQSPTEANGVDAFNTKKKLDEVPTKQTDESPKRAGAAEEPKLRPGFEEPRYGKGDREQPKPKPSLAQEPPRVAPLTLLDLRLNLNEAPLLRKVSLRGQIQRVEDDLWSIRDDKQQLSLRFRVTPPEAVSALMRAPRVAFEVIASRMDYPTGPLELISILQGGQLAYLSERILELTAATTNERQGFQLRQITSRLGQPVFEGPCRRVYEVPVQFFKGRQQLTLAPGKTAALNVDGSTFSIALFSSRYTVETPCEFSFEDPVHFIEYAIWRKGD